MSDPLPELAIQSAHPAPGRDGVSGALAIPRPNTVDYNDWRQVDIPPLNEFRPSAPVSVVIPYFEAPNELRRTVAALERQEYPRHLFEVVIVDDGSRTPPTQPVSSILNTQVLRQEHRGFGAARARNKGARTTSHDILVFLDCDTMPEAGFLAAHSRWHHFVSDSLTFSPCAFVDVGDLDAQHIRGRSGSLEALFSNREHDPSWSDDYIQRTGQLTSWDDSPFRIVAGNNLGVRKSFFESVGGFDESFTRYGAEDTEFGYRVYVRGGLLVPVNHMCVWHQGHRQNRGRKEEDLEIQRAKLSNHVPHPGFRDPSPGRIFAVPTYIVTIEADGWSANTTAHCVEEILAGQESDLVVRIEVSLKDNDAEREWLRERFGADPRVRISTHGQAIDDFPLAAFQISLAPSEAVPRDIVDEMHRALGTAVKATITLADGSPAAITRTWALHRARRTGMPVPQFGRTVAGRRAIRSGKAFQPVAFAYMGRAFKEARHIRNARTARLYVKWLFRATRFRLSRLRGGGALRGTDAGR